MRVIQVGQSQVGTVALRRCLAAQRSLKVWRDLARKIPSPDASLGDGIGRSAANATKFDLIKNEQPL